MLSVNVDFNGTFTNETYVKYIKEIDVNQECCCSCGHVGKKRFIKHGYYKRSVKTKEGMIAIYMLRVKCCSCGKTHAILHPALSPYTQVLLLDIKQIVKLKESNVSFFLIVDRMYQRNPYLTDDNVRNVLKNLRKYWRDKLLLFGSKIVEILKDENLFQNISNTFSKAFLQVKNTFYHLFSI